MIAKLKAFDHKLAIEQAGGSRELARELFNMFRNDLPVFKSNIHSAHSQHATQELLQSVHKLNGAAVYCGVPALQEVGRQLETRLKRGEYTESADLVGCLEAEIDRVLAADVASQL